MIRVPRLRRLFSAAAAIGTLLTPISALAFNPIGFINGQFGALLRGCEGSCNPINVAYDVVIALRPFATLLAGLVIIIQGMRMVISQEDEYTDKVKTTITACLAGIVAMYLIGPFVDTFYGVGGSVWNNGQMEAGTMVLAREVTGIINWVLAIVAVVAIAMIVVTGIRAIASSYSEDGLSQMRKAIMAIGSGIILLIVRQGLTYALGLRPPEEGPSPRQPVPEAIQFIDVFFSILRYLLSFLGFIALLVVLYAGFQLILNLGSEDSAKNAKGLLIRALLGFFVIIISLSLVTFVVQLA